MTFEYSKLFHTEALVRLLKPQLPDGLALSAPSVPQTRIRDLGAEVITALAGALQQAVTPT